MVLTQKPPTLHPVVPLITWSPTHALMMFKVRVADISQKYQRSWLILLKDVDRRSEMQFQLAFQQPNTHVYIQIGIYGQILRKDLVTYFWWVYL